MGVHTKLYVVPDELLPEEVLLGKDTLSRPEVRLVIESGECHLEYIPVNVNMTQAEQEDFQALIKEFSDCFATNLSELGQAANAEITINVTTDATVNC